MYHHSVASSGAWLWIIPIVVILVGIAVGFALSRIRGKRSKPGDTLSDEEEMAEVYCPDLLTEVQHLREESQRLRQQVEGQSSL